MKDRKTIDERIVRNFIFVLTACSVNRSDGSVLLLVGALVVFASLKHVGQEGHVQGSGDGQETGGGQGAGEGQPAQGGQVDAEGVVVVVLVPS